MRALVLAEPLAGTPPLLTDVPDPVPGVFAPTEPFVMGSDGAGIIDAVGDGVTGWQAGDPVLVDPLLTCGGCEHCRIGKLVFCPALTTAGNAGRPPTTDHRPPTTELTCPG